MEKDGFWGVEVRWAPCWPPAQVLCGERWPGTVADGESDGPPVYLSSYRFRHLFVVSKGFHVSPRGIFVVTRFPYPTDAAFSTFPHITQNEVFI